MDKQLDLFEKLYEEENKAGSLINMLANVIGNNNYLINKLLSTAANIEYGSKEFTKINYVIDKLLFANSYMNLYGNLFVRTYDNKFSKEAKKKLLKKIEESVDASHKIISGITYDFQDIIKHLHNVNQKFCIISRIVNKEFGKNKGLTSLAENVSRIIDESDESLYSIEYAIQSN